MMHVYWLHACRKYKSTLGCASFRGLELDAADVGYKPALSRRATVSVSEGGFRPALKPLRLGRSFPL